MTTTINELKEKLKRWDELDLLDALDITSEELVEHFSDLIEEKYARLVAEAEGEEYDD